MQVLRALRFTCLLLIACCYGAHAATSISSTLLEESYGRLPLLFALRTS
jgi:hypothetical protein